MEATTSNASPYILIGLIVATLFGSVAYGMYSSFGAGSHGLTDSIDEHARMHELGIAHSHGDKR